MFIVLPIRMQTTDQHHATVWDAIWQWLRISNKPVIKLYNGYGQSNSLLIMGHVLKRSPLPPRHYRKNFLANTIALIRLFIVKPMPKVKLVLQWDEQELDVLTDKDGFFKFEWKDRPPLPQGWQQVRVRAYQGSKEIATAEGQVYIPYTTQYGFISDIDDTFLISHSANLRKRLLVLFTSNARSRQPFDGSALHYQLLSQGNTTQEAPNPFFYVSSSEWNLYDYLTEFTRVYEMPKGVFLLNTLKRFSQLLKTGQSSHQTKFNRIVRILETYPEQRFVLLGDNSQMDPEIYEAIVGHFPQRIRAVYIRNIRPANEEKAKGHLSAVAASGVDTCLFSHSKEAIEHSRQIGLISVQQEKIAKVKQA
jgi:phosphatidate phosphatase APP1